MLDCKHPNVGDTIYYKMRSSDSPIEPDREWRGRVIRVYPKTSYAIAGVEVESLEDGHEGETELVMLSQIIKVAAQKDQTQ
jgi:hypothetical protein